MNPTEHNTITLLCLKGSYSCLEVSFQLKRKSSYYILTIYVPLLMFVTISMLSLWLRNDSYHVSIIVNILMIIMASHTASSVTNLTPPVSYTKAIDVWTGTSTCFIFFALVSSFFRKEEIQNKSYKNLSIRDFIAARYLSNSANQSILFFNHKSF